MLQQRGKSQGRKIKIKLTEEAKNRLSSIIDKKLREVGLCSAESGTSANCTEQNASANVGEEVGCPKKTADANDEANIKRKKRWIRLKRDIDTDWGRLDAPLNTWTESQKKRPSSPETGEWSESESDSRGVYIQLKNGVVLEDGQRRDEKRRRRTFHPTTIWSHSQLIRSNNGVPKLPLAPPPQAVPLPPPAWTLPGRRNSDGGIDEALLQNLSEDDRDALEKGRFTFFFTKKYPFSNHFPSAICVDSREYSCTEQYYMYMKAVTFQDEEAAEEILKARDPKEMKTIGKRIRGFDQNAWNCVSLAVMRQGSVSKYRQNLELRRALWATSGTVLVETNPSDEIWGIGLSMDDDRAGDYRRWRGKNRLGFILTAVREELWRDPEFAEEVKLFKRLRRRTF